ncbi:transcription termination/antitermination protein NusG [Chitinivibrio alkaliphilus]|uniref:Transcription termination/antitermination protein NusG n=1 Tax=Chitinivibrio alkaliphilus ACht1 TaxID=1313304 RepID=U7D511_9BACT|nr:transcription termination/antitermination protein NusG [Chitinivibrio alkaliphilus]ERP31028.1 NusG antitermination factor [Chitinivibrio alkaliphilus ACht1]
MAFKWYAVQTFTGQESRVVQYVQGMIDSGELDGVVSRVLSPVRDVVSVSRGKRVTKQDKYFPSYVLFEMEFTQESAYFVRSINGVMDFVGGRKPRPLKSAEVDRILGHEVEDEGRVVTDSPYKEGDMVSISSGPFKGFDGVVEDVSAEKGKAKVSVTVFGRATPVEVDFAQIEPVS